MKTILKIDDVAFCFPDSWTDGCPRGWMSVSYEGYRNGTLSAQARVFVEGHNEIDAYKLINTWNYNNVLGKMHFMYIVVKVDKF